MFIKPGKHRGAGNLLHRESNGGKEDFLVSENTNQGTETLTDIKVFWINILLVWIAFAMFGALAFVNLGFRLFIIVFSLINCATHIRQAFIDHRWNPGLVMVSVGIHALLFSLVTRRRG